MKDILKGKTTLITGAARGIGKATAILFAQNGSDIMINDLDATELEETKKEVQKYGVKCDSIAGDLLKKELPTEIIEKTINTFGKIDILVNNAGFTWDKMAHKMTDEMYETILAIHNVVPFRFIRAIAPYMRETGKQEKAAGKRPSDRCVINISSTSGLHGNNGQVNYATAKMGIIGLTKTIAKEWGPFGVRCNAVAFGAVETRLTQAKEKGAKITIDGKEVELGLPGMDLKDFETQVNPLQRIATPEEAAGGILLMALPQAGFITGHTLEVTGGQGI